METQINARLPWSDGSAPYTHTPHADLAAAVIKTAVDDYIKVLVSIIDAGDDEDRKAGLNARKQYFEHFFYSDMYEFYSAFLSTEIAPDSIIRNCAIRAQEKYRERIEKAKKKARKKKRTKKAKAADTKDPKGAKKMKIIKHGPIETVSPGKGGRGNVER